MNNIQMEKLAIVTAENNNPTGIFLSRADAIRQKAWCRSTNIFVLNSKGEILCHKRSVLKERMPGVWSTHLGGHVSHDETYEQNASKEMHEEAGIFVAPDQLIPWRTTSIQSAHLWVREYVTLFDGDLSELVPQPGEVDEFAWKSADEIIKAAKADPTKWCAGTHDFRTEYQCMRAALTAVGAGGRFKMPALLQTWNPPVLA